MKDDTFNVAVTKIAALVTVPAVVGVDLPTSQRVEVEAENMRGGMVRFTVPTKEAPLIGALLRVSVEEVT